MFFDDTVLQACFSSEQALVADAAHVKLNCPARAGEIGLKLPAIAYISSQKAVCSSDTFSCSLPENSMVVFGQHIETDSLYIYGNGCDVYCVAMKPELFPLTFLSEPHPCIFPMGPESGLALRFQRICAEFQQKAPYYAEMVQCEIFAILLCFARENKALVQRDGSKAANSLIYEIKQYIDNNYQFEDLSLDNIASVFHVSKSYLSHIFKEVFGLSPINYLIGVRVAHAKQLLASTNCSISEISSAVGYSNPNYFSILFRKVTGETPSAYKWKAYRSI